MITAHRVDLKIKDRYIPIAANHTGAHCSAWNTTEDAIDAVLIAILLRERRVLEACPCPEPAIGRVHAEIREAIKSSRYTTKSVCVLGHAIAS